MLWCKSDDKDDRSAKPRQRSGDSREQGRSQACDESSDDSVTAAAHVERRPYRASRPSSRHLGVTTAGLYHPRYLQSSTPSGFTEDDRRMRALSCEEVMPPPVSIQCPGVTDPDDVGCPFSMSTFSSDCLMSSGPRRLANVEILKRIFPLQPRHVLDLVLSGCNGDLVKAIEKFLSERGTFSAQHGHHSSSQHQHQHFQHQTLNLAADSYGQPATRYGSDECGDGLSVGAAADQNGLLRGGSTLNWMHAALAKSTFSTLSPLSGLGLQSAFCPPAATFTTNTLLAPAPSPHASSALLPATSRVSSPNSLLGFDGWIQSFVGTRHPMFPFLFRHHPHHLRIPHATSLVDHYTREMTSAGTAAAAAGQVISSRTMVAASDVTPGIRRAVANSAARKREVTTSNSYDIVVESQALDLHCRKDASASR